MISLLLEASHTLTLKKTNQQKTTIKKSSYKDKV